MTTSLLLATVFVAADCDLCRQPKLTYPDPETGGRVCLDCLEQLCEPLVGTERGEPLPELPPDPAICAMGEAIIAARRARPALIWVKCYDCGEQFQEALNPQQGRSAYCPRCCSDPQADEPEYDPYGD